MKRKICVVTGSRADYGLLKSLMQRIEDSKQLELQTIVTGMHLDSTFGSTHDEIEKDGFRIDFRIEILSLSDTPYGIAEAVGRTLKGCVRAFRELDPDIVLLLGDRFETFAAATAATLSRIPIAHIHGGETTQGAYDECFRHSITKMSHLHFVSTEEYRNRVIQLGENPKYVYMTGAVGIDDIMSIEKINRDRLEQILGLEFREKSLLITFHPATLDPEPAESQAKELLSALEGRKDTTIIFTGTNSDVGNSAVRDLIEKFVAINENAYYFKSLGRKLYLSCMAQVDGVVGNSSSGIIEAPSIKVGSIDIGMRQKGRIRAESVISCSAKELDIRQALDTLYSPEFRLNLNLCSNPYGNGGSSKKILEVLEGISLEPMTLKIFYDLKKEN